VAYQHFFHADLPLIIFLVPLLPWVSHLVSPLCVFLRSRKATSPFGRASFFLSLDFYFFISWAASPTCHRLAPSSPGVFFFFFLFLPVKNLWSYLVIVCFVNGIVLFVVSRPQRFGSTLLPTRRNVELWPLPEARFPESLRGAFFF